MKYPFFAIFTVLIAFFSTYAWSQSTSDDLIIRYDQPAKRWNEAIPMGNGFMGAMVFGDVIRERIQLNEGTLYSGDPLKTFDNIKYLWYIYRKK
jgi:alpha-L-fucosidase 2